MRALMSMSWGGLVRWTRDDVVATALTVLEREGLDALSLRGVAREMGAHLNSVNWHVKSKQGLIALMADAIIGSVSLDGLPAAPLDRVAELIQRYRRALLARRDGGRLVAGTFAAEGGTLRVAEALVEGLLAANFAPEEAARGCWALVYFTLGLTQEEQMRPASPSGEVPAAIESGRYPAMARVGAYLLVSDSFDARFDYGVGRLLRADVVLRPV
jgi:TetR/AcrR family tetracycline transcriptional repressor